MTGEVARSRRSVAVGVGVVLGLAWAVWLEVQFVQAWAPLTAAGLSGWNWGHPLLFVTRTASAVGDLESHAHFAGNLRTSCAAVAAFAGLVALSLSIGARVCRRLGLDDLTRGERFVLGSGFGLCAVAFAMTVLGLLQLWETVIVRAVLLGSALACAWLERASIRSLFRRGPRADAAGVRSITWWERGTVALCAVAVASLAVVGLVPQSFYDGLVYHQGVPNQWMQNGGITFLPGHFFSNFPLSHGVLGATLRFIGPDVTVGLLQPYCLAVSLVALACARRRVLPGSRFGVEGLVLLASLTVLENAPRAGNDLYVMMFFSSGILAFVRWRETRRRPWVLVLGVFLGAALSAKYTAAPYILVFAALPAVLGLRRGGARRTVADLGCLALAGLVMPLPWLVKNAVATGNPVWPLLSGVFDTRGLHAPGLAAATRMASSHVSGARDLAGLPWQASVATPDIALLIGPAFMMLLPLACLGLAVAWPRSREPALHALAVLVCWTVWAVTFGASRYATPVMATTALLYALAVDHLLARVPRLLAVATTGVTTVALWLLTSYFLAVGSLMHGTADYHGGAVDARTFLAEGHAALLPHHAQAMFATINELDDDAKVIVLGDHRTFGLERRHVSATIFDRPVLSRYLDGAHDAAELHARLCADGVTHIAVNSLEGVRLQRHHGIFDLPPASQRIWASFWRAHTDVVATFHGMVLVALVPAETRDRRTTREPIARILRAAQKAAEASSERR